MATVLTDSTNYENIADAIRNQNGTSETYYPSAMAAAISELSPPTAVLYTEQTLSDEQKAQARTNIGALSTEAVKDWAKADTKPTYTKSEIGLGNVDNVQQYSADNPPPYPVTSVNGQTGEVTIDTSSIIEQNKGLQQKFWRGTQDEYDAIETKSDDTMYIITDDSSSGGGTIGDMTKAIYDPNNIAADIFGYGYSKAEIDSLLSSGAKIQTGSYVGTGTYGASNPCSLTFDFDPKFVFIYQDGDESFTILIFICGSPLGFCTRDATYVRLVKSTGNTWSWYTDSTISYKAPGLQGNVEGFTYKWIAII